LRPKPLPRGRLRGATIRATHAVCA
jgi:hypothetical protein